MPANRPNTITALFLLALTAGCGGGTTVRTGAHAATAGLASPTADATATADATTGATASATPAAASGPGRWTATVHIPKPVTDGRIITGFTPQDAQVAAVDARTGATVWSVPFPATPGATPTTPDGVTGPTVITGPGGPVVVSLTEIVPGSGLTPARDAGRVVALDPATGRTLWTAATARASSADATAVLTGTSTAGSGGGSTTALDPRTGKPLWTGPGAAVGLDAGIAVLSRSDGGINTVVSGVDAATGRALWSSAAWAGGAQGSRSLVVAIGAGHVLVQTIRTELAGDVESLRVRDLRTGRAVGPEVPQPSNPTALLDPADGVAVVSEKVPDGAKVGPYGLDMRTGTVLWQLAVGQSAKAESVGGGLAWVDGADGYVAVDGRTGRPRAEKLQTYPLLALPGEQVTDGDNGLIATPLPG